MKCKQCGNNVRVNFGGHCSSTCRDFKPAQKKRVKYVEEDGVIFVDASDEEVIPLHLEKKHSATREALKREFLELRCGK